MSGGPFLMGATDQDGNPEDGEGPVREVAVDAFEISRYAVSNRHFTAVTNETGYVIEAELFGWSFVFHLLLPPDFPPTRAVAEAPWWRQV